MRSTRSIGVAALATTALALAGCGLTGRGSNTTTGAGPATTTAPTSATDAKRVSPGDVKDAAGAVSLCGPLEDLRRLQSTVRRFDAAMPRLQVSTLGFPGPEARSVREFAARQRTASADCDAFLVAGAAEVAPLAAQGWLLDLEKVVQQWRSDDLAPGLAPVGDGERVFGIPVRSGSPATAGSVLVVAKAGRNPGGAVALIRLLAGVRVPAKGR